MRYLVGMSRSCRLARPIQPNFSPSPRGETIAQSTENMFESLRDAIIMSTIIVFLFLASFRQILIVLFTIPMVYASTIALMWLVGIEFNVITLTAIILALGLLLDDTVVVMENIERHYSELGKDIHSTVFGGTKEIMFAHLDGTVLTPMLFVGGYPQTVFCPLIATLLLALVASYFLFFTEVLLCNRYSLTLVIFLAYMATLRSDHFGSVATNEKLFSFASRSSYCETKKKK